MSKASATRIYPAINAMGTNTDHVQNKINLVDAAGNVGVQVYFPRSIHSWSKAVSSPEKCWPESVWQTPAAHHEIVDIFNRPSKGKTHIKLIPLLEKESKVFMNKDNMKPPANLPKLLDLNLIYDIASRVF